MKHLKIAIVALMVAATSFSLKAQTASYPPDADSVSISVQGTETLNLPVFTGAEQDLQDSVQSIGAALTDSVLKSTIINAVQVIKQAPKGGSVEDWILYVFAAGGAAFGIYQYVRKRYWKQEKAKVEARQGQSRTAGQRE